MVNLAALHRSPDEKAEREARVGDFANAIERSHKRAYVNLLEEAA